MPWRWSKFDVAGIARFISPDCVNFLSPQASERFQSRSRDIREVAESIYGILCESKITYNHEVYLPTEEIQAIRTPEEIFRRYGEATCLDLALLFCGLSLAAELLPILLVTENHALVAISLVHRLRDWRSYDRREFEAFSKGPVTEASLVKELITSGGYLPIDPTASAIGGGAAGEGTLPFAGAVDLAKSQTLRDCPPLRYAIDLAIARYYWRIEAYDQLATRQNDQRSDVSHYVATFVRQYENWSLRETEPPLVEPIFRDNLKKNYVRLMCRYEHDEQVDGSVDLQACLEEWLAQSGAKYLALLGEYGSGKTSACLSLTYELLRRFQVHEGAVLPLFVPIREVLGTFGSMRQQLFDFLRENFRFDIRDENGLQQLARRFRLLLILDGLDELVNSLEIQQLERKLAELGSSFVLFNKVLFTCRSTYFMQEKNVRYIFPLRRPEFDFLDRVIPDFRFRVLVIEELTATQRQEYIARLLDSPLKASMAFTRIQSVLRLEELSRRPLLLRMILSSIDLLVDGDGFPVTCALLYGRYVDAWLQREFRVGRSRISVSRKREILRALALKFAEQGSDFIAREALGDFLVEAFGISAREHSLALDELEYDFVTCSFLTRTVDGWFGFSHRSFLEFFVAEALLEDIQVDRDSFGRIRLRSGYTRFLAELLAQGHQVEIEARCREWLKAPPCKVDGCFWSSNAATLLCSLGVQFAGDDLSGVDFSGAELIDGLFDDSKLAGANLDGCNLENASFDRSDLRRASLRNAFIKNTHFRGADLREADFWNIRMVGGLSTLWKAGYSPDFKSIVVGTGGGRLLCGDGEAPSDSSWREYPIAPTGVLHFSFGSGTGADEWLLAISDRDANVYIHKWNCSSGIGEPEETITGLKDNVRWLCWSSAGQLLAGACRDYTLKLWDFRRGRPLLRDYAVHHGPVMCVNWCLDDKYLLSGGYDKNIVLTKLESRDRSPEFEVLRHPARSSSHSGTVRCLDVIGEGSLAVSSGEDGNICVWDISHPRRPKYISGLDIGKPIFSQAAIEDRLVVCGTWGGELYLVDTFRHEVLLRKSIADNDVIRSITKGRPDTNLILSGTWNGVVNLLKLPNLEVVGEPLRLVQDGARSDGTTFDRARIASIRGLPKSYVQYLIGEGAEYS